MTAKLWIFAGPNGAGKSTLVAARVRGRIPVVNPDEVARNLPPGLVGDARIIEAGRIALAMRERHLREGETFGVATTLTGHTEIGLMRRAKAAGYRVNLAFVGLDDVELSAARVRARTSRGGHDVALADVLRRFGRSMANLSTALTIADRAYVIDNSAERRRLLLAREDGRTKHVASVLPEWAAAAVPLEMRIPPRTPPDQAPPEDAP